MGHLFIEKALAKGYEVVAYARSAQKISIIHPRLSVVVGELTNKEKIEEVVHGTDAVVSVMGPVGAQNKLIFSPAYEHIVEAMKNNGLKRIIALGTPTISDENDRFSLIFFGLIFIVGLIIKKGGDDIKKVGRIVRESGLEWTLVRTPLFTNGKKKEKITIGYFGNGIWWPWLSRENFTDFVLQQITDRTYIGKAPAISN